MNKIGIVVVCLAILGAGLLYVKNGAKDPVSPRPLSSGAESENFTTWQEFKPQSGLFKVLLPHPPQYAKDLVPIPGSDLKRRYDMYASEKINGTLFLISAITYPAEIEKSETADLLKQTVEELMRSKPNNQLLKSKESLFKTLQAVDFSIVNGELLVEGKVFMIGKTIYVLSYVTRKDEFNPVEFQHFVDSFESKEDHP